MRARPLIAALLLLGLAGCPDLEEAPIPTTCSKLADKCKLPSGPLGVCIATECGPDESAPCFVCQPQH